MDYLSTMEAENVDIASKRIKDKEVFKKAV